MPKRTYQQPGCGLAAALDLLGERWTLLIVRELMLGPQRYTDLSAGLPGLSTNLLAGRLRHLEDTGVVLRNELPPPAACTVYELTDVGAELEPMVVQLARWGSQFADCAEITDPRGAAFAFLAQQMDAPHRAVATGECRIDIDEHSIAAHLDGGRTRARPYAPADPVAVLKTTAALFHAVLSGEMGWDVIVSHPASRVEGDAAELAALLGFDPS